MSDTKKFRADIDGAAELLADAINSLASATFNAPPELADETERLCEQATDLWNLLEHLRQFGAKK